jgi:hypothetical protein
VSGGAGIWFPVALLFTSVHTFIARKRSTVKLLVSCGAAQDAGNGFLLFRVISAVSAHCSCQAGPGRPAPKQIGLATGRLTGGYARLNRVRTLAFTQRVPSGATANRHGEYNNVRITFDVRSSEEMHATNPLARPSASTAEPDSPMVPSMPHSQS